MEKQLRCKDCKWLRDGWGVSSKWECGYNFRPVNAGRYACKKFVYKDK